MSGFGRVSGKGRRRAMRREQRDRVAALASTMEAPSAPLAWRAGSTARVAAGLWCVVFAVATLPPTGGGPGDPAPGGLVFAVWTSLVAAWAACRVALWRVTADHNGVRVRRLWATSFLPWSAISHVEARRDGLLEFVGAVGEPMGGLFRPPWLSRLLGRRDTLAEAADTLTAMARNPQLRPPTAAARALTGTAFAPWAIPLGALLWIARDLFHR